VVAHPDHMLFEAAHLYFLYFLFAFTMLAMPLLVYLRRERSRSWMARLAVFLQRPGAILLLGIPAGAIEAALQSENYGGWNRYVFLLLFLYGYAIAGDAGLISSVRKQSLAALCWVLPATVLGFAVYVRAANAGVYLGQGYAMENVLWRMWKGVGGWWWVVAIYGLGSRLLAAMPGWRERGDSGRLSFWSEALHYANEAVLPFYMLHETIIVAVGFRVVRWQASMLVKYVVISLASLVGTLALYELLIRRNHVGRFLFGMRAQGR
jgi:glucan biosynthesis protein C